MFSKKEVFENYLGKLGLSKTAFEAVKEVSDMYGGENADLVDLYMRIGCLHNEIANFGIIKLP